MSATKRIALFVFGIGCIGSAAFFLLPVLPWWVLLGLIAVPASIALALHHAAGEHRLDVEHRRKTGFGEL